MGRKRHVRSIRLYAYINMYGMHVTVNVYTTMYRFHFLVFFYVLL
jgi:hypothetical protein